MLTADLVRARAYKGDVKAQYLDRDDEEPRLLAATLIETFESSIGAPRRQLDETLKDVLGAGTDFLLHRGLAKLLFDRCEFETAGDIDPVELRRRLFSTAAGMRREAGHDGLQRDDVFARVATELDVAADTIEQGLFGDLKDEQQLRAFERCDADWLIDRYNVALAQALLLRASWMSVSLPPLAPGSMRTLFRKLKFHQLLYEIEGSAGDGYTIRLDGPLSLHRSTQRYGLQMATFLPAVLEIDGFEVEASVQHGRRRVDRRFRITSKDGLRPYRKSPRTWVPDEVRTLRAQIEKLDSGWEMSDDAELIETAAGVLIPDHVFVHEESGTRVFMEVVGYWRRAPIDERIAALKAHGPANYLLAVGKGMNVDQGKEDDPTGPVYTFRTTPIARQIVARLNEFLP